MASDGIRLDVSSELGAWIDGFEELGNGPSDEMVESWRIAADELFAKADSIVHVITGQLKASGSVSVDQEGFSLSAVLLYAADYAVYEHERGGAHSWIDLAWAESQDGFKDALVDGFVRTVRSWK